VDEVGDLTKLLIGHVREFVEIKQQVLVLGEFFGDGVGYLFVAQQVQYLFPFQQYFCEVDVA